MRSMFAYFTPTNASGEPITVQQRCLSSLQIVASLWTLVGVFLGVLQVPASTPRHETIRIFEIGSLLIAMGLYSVLIPLRHILKDPK